MPMDKVLRRQNKANRKEAQLCKTTELRAAVSRYTAGNMTTRGIAGLLRISEPTVRKYKKESLERLIARTPGGRPLLTAPPAPPIAKSDAMLIRKAYALRKRMIAYGDIARHLGVPENIVRSWVKMELARLEDEELQDINLVRRLQVEQIDAMMSAIMTPATGKKIDGTRVAPQYEAMDRMMKLMEMKAKLLGLNAPQTVDINHRLEVLAFEFGYDIEQLQDIARDVIAQRLGNKALKSGT